jgi:chemotaxis protein MotB
MWCAKDRRGDPSHGSSQVRYEAVMRRTATVIVTLLSLTACVTQGEHDMLMADAQRRMNESEQQHQQQHAVAQAMIAALQTEIAELKSEIARIQTDLDARHGEIEVLKVEGAGLQAQLDEATAITQQLSQALERSGKDVTKLLAEKGAISDALSDAKLRLEELRKAQAAAQARADLFKSLMSRFKRMIDAGDLTIVVRDGRMVLSLRNDVLFQSARVGLERDGKAALAEVAGVLKTLAPRDFVIAGHTDNVPIQTDRFPSNWELSAQRAINVVKFLIEQGVPAASLSAAGYGAHDPVADNGLVDGRAKNRRIEIVLQPDLTELVQIATQN